MASTRSANGIFGTLPFILLFQFGFLYAALLRSSRTSGSSASSASRKRKTAGGLSEVGRDASAPHGHPRQVRVLDPRRVRPRGPGRRARRLIRARTPASASAAASPLKREEAEAVAVAAPRGREAGSSAAEAKAVELASRLGRHLHLHRPQGPAPPRGLRRPRPARAGSSRACSSPSPRRRSRQYFLYQLITEERPDIIVDAVNTATGIAYQDIYKTSRLAYQALKDGRRPAREPRDAARHRLRPAAHPPRPGPLPVHGEGGHARLREDRHLGHRRDGPQHPLHAFRGEALARPPVQERAGRRPHPAPLPDGAHARTARSPRRSSPRPPSPGSASASARSCAADARCRSTTPSPRDARAARPRRAPSGRATRPRAAPPARP